MVKFLFCVCLVGLVSWCLFGVRLENRPLVDHCLDVWRSPTVQQKVKLVKSEVPRALDRMLPDISLPWDSFNKAPSPAKHKQSPSPAKPSPEATMKHPHSPEKGSEQHTEQDRRALESLLHEAREAS